MVTIKHYAWWMLGWVCLVVYGSAVAAVWLANKFATWFEPYAERVMDKVRSYE